MKRDVMTVWGFLVAVTVPWLALQAQQQDTAQPVDTSRGDAMLAEYFRQETQKLTDACLAEIQTLDDWTAHRDEYRRQLFEMLGLDPLPEKTPLHATVTGRVHHADFIVEKLHFQSRPHLYVTGNLYIPRNLKGKAPAVLYVCGHGGVKKAGISYGNKVHYQHHGAWFARNGYVCLTIDTLQLGEIEGIHHGTYRYGMWWWNCRGYTPAGVEAWNCIRALDYLQSRPEVDPDRIGVTGRSGGGAYSWWISTLDDRIKVAVPVAGITTLKNHVVDGTVEGHCDCMFPVNTYRWDYPQIAALVAPRPLLISNSDKDRIFPLDGVVDLYFKTRRIYTLHDKLDQIGLNITEGPHRDTQELRVHAFHWFNRFLKQDPAYKGGQQPLIEMAAVPFFEPEELKVFDTIPEDQINTEIQETFVPKAEPPALPQTQSDWERQRNEWLAVLYEKCFRGWPATETGTALQLHPVFSEQHKDVALSAFDFTSQEPIRLRLYVAHKPGLKPGDLDLVVLNVLDDQGWQDFLAAMQPGFADQLKDPKAGIGVLPDPDPQAFQELAGMFGHHKWAMAYVAPRGIGPTAWNRDDRKRVQIRRRFMLLGQTRDGMRVWDVRRASQALRTVEGFQNVPLWLQGEREMAGISLYASLFEPDVQRLDLWHLSPSHRQGPIFLNVLRFLDVPQALALAAERSKIRLYQDDDTGWTYPQSVAKSLGWGAERIQIRSIPDQQKKATE